MGLVVRNGTMFVTVGRNDREGWAITMELAGFVASLTPLRTKVLSDKFFKHISYSVVEHGSKVDGDGSGSGGAGTGTGSRSAGNSTGSALSGRYVRRS